MSDHNPPKIAKKKSPWANVPEEKGSSKAPDINVLKGEWIRQETQKFMAYLDAERHLELQDFVNDALPQFPNQMYGLTALAGCCMHYDALESAVMALASGGKSPEGVIAEVIEAEEQDSGALIFYNAQIDRLTELEVQKEFTSDETTFKKAFLTQLLVLHDAYGLSLRRSETDDLMSDVIIGNIMETLQERIDTHLDTPYPNLEKQSIAHWPMAAKMAQAMQDVNGLHLQASAAVMSLLNQLQNTAYDDPQTTYTLTYTEAIRDFTAILSQNIMLGLQGEVYFFDMLDVQNHFYETYGDVAEDPDTEWVMDENLMLQTKINILSDQIIQHIAAEGVYDDEPEFLIFMARASQHIKDLFAEKFPVSEDLKPQFVKDIEDQKEQSLLTEAGEHDTILPKGTNGANAKRQPRP